MKPLNRCFNSSDAVAIAWELEALYPKPRLSKAHLEQQVYPSLLRDLSVTQSNQVWCTDITDLPVRVISF